MSRVRITLAAGGSAGQQMIFDPPRVTFGRSGDSDIVFDLEAVSRRHGELVFEHGKWMLHNHSPNGTKVGRRTVKSKPKPVTGLKTIRVGSLPLMRVEVDPAVPVAAEEAADEPGDGGAAASGSKGSARLKIWLGIAAFWVVLLGLVMVLSTLNPGGDADADDVERLSRQRIETLITRPVETEAVNERRRNAALARARRHYGLIGSDPGALFACYEAYRQAKALSENATLPEAIDELRYREVESRLLEEVTERYEAAYTDYRSGRYLAAERAWRELAQLYPNPDSVIFDNAQAFLRASRQRSR